MDYTMMMTVAMMTTTTTIDFYLTAVRL